MVRFSWTLPDKNEHTVLLLSGKSTSRYAFFIRKKAFTPSHGARFRLILSQFKCEGLDFQVFTTQGAFIPLTTWFSAVFLHKGLLYLPFTSVHRPCEYLKIKTFTLETYENQQETRSVWMDEYFFREILSRIYTRAKGKRIRDAALYTIIHPSTFAAWK